MDIQLWATVFVIVGHISFGLTFLSYAQRDIIKLRMIAVASLICGLSYNSWIQYRMSGDGDIWLVIAWLGVFLVQNIFLLVREIRDGLEVSLPAESRTLLVKSFPTMHSRDWQKLMSLAKVSTFSKGAPILKEGDSTYTLQLIASGVAIEDRGGVHRECGAGTLWGELTFVMGEDSYNASPVTIFASSDKLVVYSWPYDDLRRLCSKSLRITAALQHGFIHSAGLKHGLLWNQAHARASSPSLALERRSA